MRISRSLSYTPVQRSAITKTAGSHRPQPRFSSQDKPQDRTRQMAQRLSSLVLSLRNIAEASGLQVIRAPIWGIDLGASPTHLYFTLDDLFSEPLGHNLARIEHERAEILFARMGLVPDPLYQMPHFHMGWHAVQDVLVEKLFLATAPAAHLRRFNEMLVRGRKERPFIRRLTQLIVADHMIDEELVTRLLTSRPDLIHARQFLLGVRGFGVDAERITSAVKSPLARDALEKVRQAVLDATRPPSRFFETSELTETEKLAACENALAIYRERIWPHFKPLMAASVRDLSTALKTLHADIPEDDALRDFLDQCCGISASPFDKEAFRKTIPPGGPTQADLDRAKQLFESLEANPADFEGTEAAANNFAMGETVWLIGRKFFDGEIPEREEPSEDQPEDELEAAIDFTVFMRRVDPNGEFARAVDAAMKNANADQAEHQKRRPARKNLTPKPPPESWQALELEFGAASNRLRTSMFSLLSAAMEPRLDGPYTQAPRFMQSRIPAWIASGFEDRRLFGRWSFDEGIWQHFAVIGDASGSMAETHRKKNLRAGAFTLMGLVGLPQVAVSAALALNRQYKELMRLAQGEVSQAVKAKVIDEIQPYNCENGDFEGLDWAWEVEQDFRREHPRGISHYLVISDGQGYHQGWSAAELQILHNKIARLRRVGARVFGLGIGEEMDSIEVYGDHEKLRNVSEIADALTRYVERILRRS